MNLFDKLRKDKIASIIEATPRTTEMWLETSTRGPRTRVFKLGIDEIEDILSAEETRREKPYPPHN